MSTTVIACIQPVPHGDAASDVEGEALEVKEVSATAEDYLSAVDEVHTQVPEGWRVLYVRSADAPAVPAPVGANTSEHGPGQDASTPTPTAGEEVDTPSP